MDRAHTSLEAEQRSFNATMFNSCCTENDIELQNLYPDPVDAEVLNTVIKIEKYIMPVICIFGLVGNSLATVTFLRRPLRNSPCSLYLATRGISDNGFLLSLFLIWTSSTFNLQLSRVKGVCQVTIFMTYVCGCISVWLCVFVTFENFLLIHSPFRAKRVCGNHVSRISLAVLILGAVGLYNTSFWIVNEDCTHKVDYYKLTQALVYADTLLTLVLPTVIIFCLVSVITYKLLQILHIRKRHSEILEKVSHVRTVKPIIPIAKVTKMLFAVSLTFFALNFPSHVIRLMLLVSSLTNGNAVPSTLERTIQALCLILYYTSFSINIFVYMIFGSNFRKMFRKSFCSKKDRSVDIHTPTEAVNLVRQRRHSINGVIEENQNEGFLMIPNTGNGKHCHSFG